MHSISRISATQRGFALVVTLSMMVLITLLTVGMLGLATIELRKTGHGEARAVAMANARLAMMLALGELQSDLGDDRRISADAMLLPNTKNPGAVGAWTGWSPNLSKTGGASGRGGVDYQTPKGQRGFRGWLVSDPNPPSTAQLDWHLSIPESGEGLADLFTLGGSGFDLGAKKVPTVSGTGGKVNGSFAWAVAQENTKASINIGTDDSKRVSIEDRLQSPSRPSLALSSLLTDPGGNWLPRSATITSLSQAVLETGYRLTPKKAGKVAKEYTVNSYSLLTDPVKGGLKVDLTTAFEMPESEFAATSWPDGEGSVANPFRSATPREYKGQKPLFRPQFNSAQVQVYMPFEAASVNHKFQVNGVPTFDTLRSHYRIHRHLYQGAGGETAFERPYSHIATPETVAGRPFGNKSQTSLNPVLDRMNLIFSIYAKADGTLGILLSPIVTIWNPYNVDIETEGLVVYPWIDFAVFWNWNVAPAGGSWNSSLSRFVGEGFQGHGRSSRPYFYLHLTQSGTPGRAGQSVVNPPIRLAPGEVRVFCLADSSRRDLEIRGTPQQRTWQMRPVGNPSDITASTKGGIVLNMTKSIGGGYNFNYKLKAGDRVNANQVSFDRGTYFYIVNMADAYQIKNPGVELMVEARPAGSGLPALPAEKNLVFYSSVHSGQAHGKGNDLLSYPSFSFEEIKETPKMVGSLLTYHQVAESGSLPLSDLMYTTNPRQPHVNSYLSGAKFQTGPHYESVFRQGTSLAQLAMETTPDGAKAFYGPSHSVVNGRSNLPFFEVPRTPTLSLGALQHCDISATAFTVANQIGNSWASPYLSANVVRKTVSSGPGNESISPNGMAVNDHSYLANEALFDSYYFSGAAPQFGTRKSATGSTTIWQADQIPETKGVTEVLGDFFQDPTANPLRNPRMILYRGGISDDQLRKRFESPARCVRLASHLLVEGGFNVNSTNVEAWTAILASLRGVAPAGDKSTAQSRFRHILAGAPVGMDENDPWTGFRSLSDEQIRTFATNLVVEIKARGPFLSLGEFVNRRVTTDRKLGMAGAIQAAIDNSGLNQKYSYAKFTTNKYPNPENILNPNTGTNTPGWLTQADVLNALAPFITPRSDTFVIRTMGEAKDAKKNMLYRVRLEAVVQRIPDWLDPSDDPETEVANLKSEVNKSFGRRFELVSIKEIDTTTVY